MLATLVLLFALLAAEGPAAAPAMPAIEVSGRVVNAQGKPAAKVPIELTAIPSAAESRQLQLAGKTRPDPLAKTVTDADGRFELSAPGIGMYHVTARAAGAVPAETALLPLIAPVELSPLRLETSEPLRVRAPGGKPGVRVEAMSSSRPRAEGWIAAPRLAITDDAGSAILPRAHGEALDVAAAVDFGEVRAARVTGAALDLRAQQSCPRQLIVKDANGQAASGVALSTAFLVLGLTDAEGKITIAAPCRSELRLFADAADGRRARPRLQPANTDSPPPLEVTLEAPDRYAGRVVDAETRAPLAGALVWTADDPAGFVRSDAKGTYTLATPARGAAGPPDLRAAAAGHLPRSEKSSLQRGVGPTFALQPTAALAGAVVDSGGKPIAAAEIHLAELSPENLLRFRVPPEGLPTRAVSKTNGAFRIDVLPRRAYTLRASREGFAPATLTVAEKLLPGATRSGLKIVLTSGVSAFGKIVDERAQPVAAAEVRLVAATAKASLPSYLRPERDDEPEEPAVYSDGQGGFRFEHLRAGSFDLIAKADGFAPRTLRGLAIASGPPTDLGAVTLERGATLTGSVEDRRGRPLEDATVALLPPSPAGIRGDAQAALAGKGVRDTTTQRDGRFTLDGLLPGETVDIVARKGGFVPATLPQVEIPAEKPVTIVLEPAASVSGHVKSDMGEPVVGAVVSIRPAEAALPAGLSGRVAQTDAEGAFVLEDLAAGKVTLSATAKDYMAGDPLVLDVAEGRSVEGVEITLRRGATIEGVVLTPTGQPATSARVTLRRNWTPDRMLEIEVAGAAQTDGDGHYRMDGVATGAQIVTASQEGYQNAVRDLEVRAGMNRLDLRLAEGQSISGEVIDGQGRPLAGAAVTLLTAGPGSGREDVSGGDGAFRFQGLGAGHYVVSAHKEGYAAARRELDLADQPMRGIELRLQQGGGVITGRILGLPPQTIPQLQITAVKRPMDNLDAMREGHADQTGGYRVEGVYPGQWSVTARLPSGRQAQKTVTVADANAPAQADLEFGRGVTLSGHVRRAAQPVPNAMVQATGTSVDSSGSAVTDSGGAFRIEGLTAGEHKLVVAVAQSGLRSERVLALSADQSIDVDLPTARAGGQVVDAATRAPLAGVAVVAEPAGAGTPDAFSPRATTDSSGAFELTNLARGSYRITADKEGYVRGNLPVEIPSDDAAADGLRISLDPEQGLVLDIAGSAGIPPRVTVALLDPNGQLVFLQSVSTGENGRARVASAPAGQFRALVAGDATATARIAVTIPGPPVPVVLARAARVTVEVAELAGRGAVGSVALIDAEGQPFRSVSRGTLQQEWPLVNGVATIDGLPAGRYTVRATVPGGKSWQGSVVAVEGQETRTRL